MHYDCRSYCSDVHAMGTRPLRSRSYWAQKVDDWRKEEAYIALGRYCLDYDDGYKQWDCFLFRDYTIRAALSRTFRKRHLPLSNGFDEENFDGQYTFDWDAHAWAPISRKIKADSYRVKPEPMSTKSPAPRNERPMVWDVELNKLVPM